MELSPEQLQTRLHPHEIPLLEALRAPGISDDLELIPCFAGSAIQRARVPWSDDATERDRQSWLRLCDADIVATELSDREDEEMRNWVASAQPDLARNGITRSG